MLKFKRDYQSFKNIQTLVHSEQAIEKYWRIKNYGIKGS